ncbi:PQQ-binding-like beta-propeller repeat protein [Haloferula chungangensis]|uniref:PQQ-binding-like beta-propeller repeat protein n=1 Tax=Haloferula chungangensis TaxID=1048331 RepID=A0ABW2LAE9_9BACT
MPAFLFAVTAMVGSSLAQDWPRYLGPDGNARVDGKISTDWASKKPVELWKKQLGAGCTSFAIVDGKAVVMGNDGGKDTVWCLEAKTGDVIWKYEYEEELQPKLYAGGPNATPTIDGDVVYTLSKTGNLFCLSMADGKPVWHKHYQSDFGGTAPSWGYSASPIVRGSVLYCLPCAKDEAVYVLNAKTGEVESKFGGKTKPGYAAPVFFDYQGTPAMAGFYGRELVGYNLKTGKELFEFTWRTSYDINASNPQYLDGNMFLASGYGMGYAVIDVTKSKAEVLHKEEDTRMIFQNSILIDGDILGVFGDKNIDAELIRMDLKSGKIHWRESMPGTRGSSLMVGDTLVILSEKGDIIVGNPAKSGWKEQGRVTPLSGLCWAPVAYSDGMIFARSNKGEAVCLKVD